MRYIDARSGAELHEGSHVVYPEGEGYEVLLLESGIFSGRAVIRELPTKRMRTVRLKVRYMHPGFPFQRVAFFPS